MSEQKKQASFQYTYSAQEQEELLAIREKYLPKKENKMEMLRRLDAQPGQKASMVSIILGVIGALILGLGMSCCMVWAGAWFLPGICIGLVGIALVCAAYPLYKHVLKKERERLAPEILSLTNQLMK